MSKLDKYKLAFEISPVPMLLVSSDGLILQTNALLDQLFNYSPSELIGESVDILVPESAREHHPTLRTAYFKIPSKRQMGHGRDLTGITKTAQIIPLELGLDSVEIEGEVCALVVALDIRQRKQHERRMNLAMDAAASAMIMVDQQGLIVFVNKAAVDLFGYETNDLLNCTVEKLVPTEFQRAHPVYRHSFMSLSRTRQIGTAKGLYALHRSGKQIPVEIALTPVETPNGRLVVSTIIDLTERVAAEQAMKLKSAELERLNSELSQFTYSASHDLKAPLSTITGLLRICIEDLADGNVEEVRENLIKCMSIGKRSAEKVEGVLEIARVGSDEELRESVILEDIIRQIWLDMTGANEDHIRFNLDLKHQEPIVIEPQTIKVVLENLISNAIRYGDEEKNLHCIEVASRDEAGRVVITIFDNGIGIPDDKQQIVFDMFKKLDARSGDGLGLALVRKQVSRLNGHISLTSTVGEGTRFTISLPRDDEVTE